MARGGIFIRKLFVRNSVVNTGYLSLPSTQNNVIMGTAIRNQYFEKPGSWKEASRFKLPGGTMYFDGLRILPESMRVLFLEGAQELL
ncbi:hypothetical protein CDAR_478831 [Caerostris darwini]|uniref:Uncharacterized protein n=1 Tax=Caerostris darwini TaxID=1538125 RepID=A0AAV4RQ80_9ARAC|nr:hypothetical protein CDAR_478831 [Caerostris darwini]